MSLEEEIEMLEKAKEHYETALKNINERLEKLKE
jgi:prefoldin subunit 5